MVTALSEKFLEAGWHFKGAFFFPSGLHTAVTATC
jgi:hypothetical protein